MVIVNKEIMVMKIGETFVNNKVGYRWMVSPLKYSIYFGHLVHSQDYKLILHPKTAPSIILNS